MIKKLFGIAPQATHNVSYEPSSLALKLSTSPKTDYTPVDFDGETVTQGEKILMICTEQGTMKMKNGKVFSTGNHPVEMLVPMLHLQNADFEIEIATPTGKPVQIEKWAMPEQDEAVMQIYYEFKARFENPESLASIVENQKLKKEDYIAIFFPGGHGAMLGLPKDENVGEAIQWALKNDKYILAICHGPAALLSTATGASKEDFPFENYKIAAFPDIFDKILPLFGYLPGRMPWYFNKKLKSLGMKVVNKTAGGSCHKDRKLITGDSPEAANDFGKLAAKSLLKALK